MTQKQWLFAQEYLVDLNGAAAARRAGYSAGGAKNAAWRLLRDPEVKRLVKEEMEKRAKVVRLKQQDVVQELRDIAFAQGSDASGAAVKLASKLRALELLGKHMGLFQDRPVEQQPVKIVEDV